MPQHETVERQAGSPPQETRRARLFVERRAARREERPPAEAGSPLIPPRWVVPAAGVAVAVPVTLLAGPVGLAVTASVLAAAQTAIVTGVGRRAERLDELAHTDHLTGLLNSRALWRDLDGVLAERAAGLVMADLDHFKSVNDGHGHAAGDAVLRAVGALLPGIVGDEGRCYRYGGEEFVIVLPDAGEQRGAVIAERLRSRVAGGLGGTLPALTLSAGVAEAAPGCPGHRLLDRADSALRRAKLAGRDRIEHASRIDDRQAAEDGAALAARRAALAIATAALEARDPDTAEHSDDVVVLCEAIADRLGIRGAEREHLLIAASLHDVGKVAIPHDILDKPGPLDDAEWEVMREHTITGEQILRSVPELEPVAPLVRSAHERYDGKGYPDGLAGEEIPLASRVILCADAFHAMRSDRPYRRGRSAEAAAEELQANSGTQFDPVVAATLIGVVRDAGDGGPTGVRRMLRRSPRLAVLVATAAIGGTAMAAVPSLPEKLRDIVRGGKPALVAPAPERTSPGSGGAFAPLLETKPVAPAAVEPRERNGKPGKPEKPGKPSKPEKPGKKPKSTAADSALAGESAATGSSPAPSSPGSSDAAPGRTESTPGQSGSAPGHSGDTPGKGGEAPGQAGTAPGLSGDTPGKSGDAPGRSGDDAPGNSGSAPGHSGEAPGNSGNAPGQSGDAPGNSGNAPGQSQPSTGSEAPGNSGNAPGNSGGNGSPGNSGNAPGKGGGRPSSSESDAS